MESAVLQRTTLANRNYCLEVNKKKIQKLKKYKPLKCWEHWQGQMEQT